MNRRQAMKHSKFEQPQLSQEQMLLIIQNLTSKIENMDKSLQILNEQLAAKSEVKPQVYRMNLFYNVAKLKVEDTIKLVTNHEKYSPEKLMSKFERNLQMIKNAFEEIKEAIMDIPHNISEFVNELKDEVIEEVTDLITYAKEVIEINLQTPKRLLDAAAEVMSNRKEQIDAAAERFYQGKERFEIEDEQSGLVQEVEAAATL